MEAKTFLTCELERYVTDTSNLKSEHRREMKQEREKVQKLEEKVIGLMREMREQQAQNQLQMNTMRCRYRYNERELRNELAAADEKIDRMKMNPELQRDETILNLRAENEELKKATERMRKEFNIAKVEGLAMEMAIEDWKNEYQKLTSTVTTIKEEAKQVKEMMRMRTVREQPNCDRKVLDIETAIESAKQGKENIECKIMKALKTGLDAMTEENQQFKKDMLAKDEKRKQEVTILEAQLKESKKCNKQLQEKLTDTQRALTDRVTTIEYRMKNSTDLESKVMKLANKQELMDCMALQRDSRIEDHEREHKVQLGRLEDQLKLERTSNTNLRKDRDNLLQRVAKLERHPNFIDGDNGRGMPRSSHEMPKSKSCLRDQEMEVKMLPKKLEEANQKLQDKTKCDEERDARICALECGMSQLLQGTTEKKTLAGFPTQTGRKESLLIQLQRNNDDRAVIEQELQILLNIQEHEAEASMMKEDMINCLKNQVGVLQYNLMTNDEELYATKLLAVQQSRTIEDLRTSNQVNRERTDSMDDGEQVESKIMAERLCDFKREWQQKEEQLVNEFASEKKLMEEQISTLKQQVQNQQKQNKRSWKSFTFFLPPLLLTKLMQWIFQSPVNDIVHHEQRQSHRQTEPRWRDTVDRVNRQKKSRHRRNRDQPKREETVEQMNQDENSLTFYELRPEKVDCLPDMYFNASRSDYAKLPRSNIDLNTQPTLTELPTLN
ncbi:hypothetical protein BSL78_05296 [Apostichopus japonicus]|uniref:Uncharacterized protein n=1 Tax=Stichopus japonicus TaxID=307972 RepID=A0A2G8LC94_STIJA|nr:hypothetical protein BSL78_05296 [Apostichopus japonicus]